MFISLETGLKPKNQFVRFFVTKRDVGVGSWLLSDSSAKVIMLIKLNTLQLLLDAVVLRGSKVIQNQRKCIKGQI